MKLINFYIGDMEYTAEENSTFKRWLGRSDDPEEELVDRSYGEFIVSTALDGRVYIYRNGSNLRISHKGRFVSENATIIEDREYEEI